MLPHLPCGLPASIHIMTLKPPITSFLLQSSINMKTMTRHHCFLLPPVCPQSLLAKFFSRLFTWNSGQINSPPLPQHTNEHLLKCIFSKILTHSKTNLKETYDQGIEVQFTIKDVKK